MLGQSTSVEMFSPTGGQFKAKVQGPLGTPAGLAIGDGKVWAWSQDSRNLKAYDAHTLKPLADFTTPYQISNAAALDGKLYVSTTSGLYYSDEGSAPSAPATKVPGIVAAYGLAADPARHRVIVGAFNGSAGGAQIDAVQTRTGKVSEGAQTTLGKESIAVAGGEIWVGGYGSEGPGRTNRLLHLDANTLQIMGSSPLSDMLGPGAVVWPGQRVVWVSAGGDASISCVNPRNGSVLAEWSAARGPVASVGGSAYALNPNVVPLVLTNACTG
jgi:outer membrane protein assembly factor BamB